jgi:hypothetical protein
MSHSKSPPSLPTIVDEAGDSPSWVPILGIVLFAVGALLAAARMATQSDERAQPAPVQEQETQPSAATAAPE